MGYYKNLEIEQQDKEIAANYQKKERSSSEGVLNANYGKLFEGFSEQATGWVGHV